MSELGPGATGLPLSPAGSAPGQGPSNESASGHRLGLGQVGDVVFSYGINDRSEERQRRQILRAVACPAESPALRTV